MLKLSGIKKVYKTKSGEVVALNEVDLTLPEKGMVFISGKSGSGKTTLLNIIGGLDGCNSGEISLYGKSFKDFTQADYDDYRNTFVGFIFQEYNLLSEYSVQKNIEMALELQGRSFSSEEILALLRSVGIEDERNRKVSELSGGQRQRVAIARALVKNPSIIMADEPTGALDSNTGAQVLGILKELSKEKLVIVVSHDQEFANLYADRIITMVDGTVSEDVTFFHREIDGNVADGDNALMIREGALLTDNELKRVAESVKDRKKIEVITDLFFRKAEKTESKKIAVAEKNVTLTKSKMKLKSAIFLGLNSLKVKPVRLVFTILLSVIALAVFGLFDTVAHFNTAKVVNNLLKNTSSVISLYGEYIVDYPTDDKYDVKFSSEYVNEFASSTRLKTKGVYDFFANSSGNVSTSMSILEWINKPLSVGKNYYSTDFNGYIEFSPEEIDGKKIGSLGYELYAGVYPVLYYDEGVPSEDSMKHIAISRYTAQSIMRVLNGEKFCDKEIKKEEDLLDTQITVDKQKRTIVGIIDCGDIDEKFNKLKDISSVPPDLKDLNEEFKTFIGSGAHKCIFAPYGLLKETNNTCTVSSVFYGGNAEWEMSTTQNKERQCYEYVYSAEGRTNQQVLLFNGDNANENVAIADDQVLIHVGNIKTLFDKEYLGLSSVDKMAFDNSINVLSSKTLSIDSKISALEDIVALLKLNENEKTFSLTKTSDHTLKKITKQVKVVGVYVNVDVDRTISTNNVRLMMNENCMKEYDIFAEQGNFSRLIVDTNGNPTGLRALATVMASTSGLTLGWYRNSALNTIRYNEPIIRQGANLFLYVAIVLACISVFMIFNYISTSIANKRQNIGVLRGLGARGKDVLLMFLSESFIIGIINAILAIGLTVVGCVLVNAYIATVMSINIPFALFGVRQGVIIALLSLVTSLLSSWLPIIKISKEKPVDLIRR